MNKKLFTIGPLIAIAFAIMSFTSKLHNNAGPNNKAPASRNDVAADTTLQITLNGVDALQAQAMEWNFVKCRGQDKGPIRESIWFDKVTIRRMYDLLYKELQDELETQKKTGSTNNIGLTDGVRIYFVSDTNTKTGHLKNSVVLVSTKNGGYDPSVISKAYHIDYYTHSRKDSLFSDNSNNYQAIRGMPLRRQWINTRGENLYNISFNKKEVANCDSPHYIVRDKAHKMVNQFGKDQSGRRMDSINTKSEWFDLKLLRSFAYDPDNDGLRIYFSRHLTSYNNIPDTDAYKDAFVLITTVHKKFLFFKARHQDSFDCNAANQYFLQFKTTLDVKTISKTQTLSPVGTNTALIQGGGQDNGELCPTHCQGTTPPPPL